VRCNAPPPTRPPSPSNERRRRSRDVEFLSVTGRRASVRLQRVFYSLLNEFIRFVSRPSPRTMNADSFVRPLVSVRSSCVGRRPSYDLFSRLHAPSDERTSAGRHVSPDGVFFRLALPPPYTPPNVFLTVRTPNYNLYRRIETHCETGPVVARSTAHGFRDRIIDANDTPLARLSVLSLVSYRRKTLKTQMVPRFIIKSSLFK